MSDDLERAASALHNAWDALGDCPGEIYASEARTLSGAALLSFLDMDEAGVERLARVLFRKSFPGHELDEANSETTSAVYRHHARAVLSELRKMAGEKDG